MKTPTKEVKEKIIEMILKKYNINFEWHKHKRTYGREFVDWVILDAFKLGKKEALEDVEKIINNKLEEKRKEGAVDRDEANYIDGKIDILEWIVEEIKQRLEELSK